MPSPSRGNQSTRIINLIASSSAVVGLAGFVIGLVQSDWNELLTAALVIFALLVLATLWLSRRWQIWITTCAALIFLIGGFAVWAFPSEFGGETNSPAAKPASSPSAAASKVTVIQPAPGDSNPVKGCLSVRFEADVPATQGFVLAYKDDDDDLYHFHGGVVRDAATGEYRGLVWLGVDGDGMRKRFDIFVVEVDSAWATYLSDSVKNLDPPRWDTKNLPPGASSKATQPVFRNDDKLLGSGC